MIREFFYLQKSDRKVILTLLVVIVSVFTMIFLTGRDSTETTTQQKDSIKSRTSKSYNYSSYTPKKVERFTFDPNTADSTQLLRLGLQPWQVRNIYKYRAAGGIYRKPLDFAKLYGLTVKQYRELEPYIRISSDYLPASTLVKEKEGYSRKENKDSTTYQHPVKIKATDHIVLNTADTTSLVTIPGIGPYYARKIVQYGNRLGGYVSVNQLDEIDDFPTEAKKYLVISNPSPKKLNVNKLTLNELKRHPYINFYQAKAITDYRRVHGDIHSLNDLRLIKDFSPEVIKRLTPYVAY
ncbi:helix-hairpin-helix domain-containing protein [Xylanibacter ruminicola]|uniref:DNA uptake protein ComE n=1 Tax=Xylanibacter ruminicola TaxID=839 RepID=A0A1M6XPK3_XYLRU|nr:helix-hairpin-helix domain-containing protein [Xylanibacter ruminicola]SHL07884.1 DNA uptake protein ComE [Xylanibacter ruminicola]